MKETRMPVPELLSRFAPYNPNEMTDDEVEDLSRFITYAGVLQPIVVNERTGLIVGGHNRVRAAAKAGLVELPVWVIDVDEPTEKIINIGLNKRKGRFKGDDLALVLRDIEKTGVDVTLTGFPADDVASMIESLNPKEPAVPQESAGPRPVVSYSIIFDHEQQQQAWYGFIRSLKDRYPDAHSIGERLVLHIQAIGSGRV